jgi:serine/threonine protein kinase/Tfp pilus assembly protein PilF
VGRFEIVRELGRGGFGVVYEARDRELGRSVAFKAVAAGPNAALREERLLREAEAAARLSHPNLVTLYDVGRAEQGPFLVLELLRGQTLARRLELGALSVREALRVGLQAAKGLAHAHAAGVVHRDLTPSNVFLCHDGQVKVLDLGLAHAFGRRKMEGGTAAYMAPEQESGAPEDERTDVFALGVVLYRMLTGHLPSPIEPRPSGDAPALVAEVPALGDLVRRMLQRDPVRRPRDAGEGAGALEALQAELLRGTPDAGLLASVRPASAVTQASVAVLPFSDLSPEKDHEWMCDGIAEEILHALSGLTGLRVASRSASFQFKGRAVDGREMARAIGVTNLLEGSVRISGKRARVTARLAGEEGYELWSETFDRVLEDVFAVQEEIAKSVAGALSVQLSSGEARRLQRSGTRNPLAYEKYLRARLSLHWSTSARDLLRDAVALDPGFAEAHATLADVDYLLLESRIVSEMETIGAEALAASEEALRLNPALAEAHVARANLLVLTRRPAQAEAEFRRAVALNPGLGDAWYYYGRFLAAGGRPQEAAQAFEEAARRGPERFDALTLLPQLYRTLGDTAAEASAIRRAQSAAERWIALNPADVRATYMLAGMCLQGGDRDRAFALAARALTMQPEDFGVLYNLACLYSNGGDLDRALELLDRAVATGRGLRAWFENDSDLDRLRGDYRFKKIISRLPP